MDKILKENGPVILKRYLMTINKERKAISKRDDTIRKALETHSGSRSNAHWKNVQANEVSFKVIEDTKKKILDLDSYINFSNIIGFDLYNFKPELMDILGEIVEF